MSGGLLCAAELKATSATRRTFRSGSCSASRNSPIELRSSGSIACGCNEICVCVCVCVCVSCVCVRVRVLSARLCKVWCVQLWRCARVAATRCIRGVCVCVCVCVCVFVCFQPVQSIVACLQPESPVR